MSDEAPATGTEGTQSTETETTETETTTESTTDHAAEAAKWKAAARKHEERAKANADAVKRLAELEKSTMSDTDKAVAEAKAAARAEVLKEVGGTLVDAKVEALMAGRSVDVTAVLEGLDRSRFLTDDGQPDVERLAEWVDRIAPKPDPNAPVTRPVVDMGQGARTSNAAGQITDRAALKTMTPKQIEEARRAGRIDFTKLAKS